MVGPLCITHLVWSCRKGGRGGADPFIVATDCGGFFFRQAAFGAFSWMKNVCGILFRDSACLLLLNQAETQVCLLLRKNEWSYGKSEEEQNNYSSSPLNFFFFKRLPILWELRCDWFSLFSCSWAFENFLELLMIRSSWSMSFDSFVNRSGYLGAS